MARHLTGVLSSERQLTGVISVSDKREYPVYAGTVEIVPGTEEITLGTGGKIVMKDISIKPIPSNYGKVTWNGISLKVE